MRYAFVLVLLVTSAMMYAQKVYINKISNSYYNANGYEKYQYHEINDQIVPNGTYSASFTQTSNSDRISGSETITITGLFKNGEPYGLWTYSCKFNNYGSNLLSGTITLTQSWLSGKPHGQFKYAKNVYTRDVHFDITTRRAIFSKPEYDTSENEIMIFNFSNGKLDGKITYQDTPTSPISQYFVMKEGQTIEYKANIAANNRKYAKAFDNGYIYEQTVIRPRNDPSMWMGGNIPEYERSFKYIATDLAAIQALTTIEQPDSYDTGYCPEIPKKIFGYEFWGDINKYATESSILPKIMDRYTDDDNATNNKYVIKPLPMKRSYKYGTIQEIKNNKTN